MLLRDLMEEKQLNFNRPLLSVRKSSDYSSPRLPPLYPQNSELKSGSLRNAGAIPFMWEKTPGRPKDETKLPTLANIEQPHITPNLPPGRVLSNINQQDSDVVSKDTIISTFFDSQIGASFDENVTKDEGSKEGIEEKGSYDSDDGDDEAFQDALDTLSRSESFFMSCRMNGWDDQEEQVQQPGSFSSDQRARNFMIDRFLPAAKAMTYETTSVQGQQKQLKRVLSTKKSPPLIQHSPKSLRQFVQEIGVEESEDENDDCENCPTTACGLFPRFRLMNPMPGLRMEDKARSTSSHNIETTKEHARHPYHVENSVDSNSEFTKEKAILGILDKFKHICESTDPNQIGSRKSLDSESTQTSCDSPIEKTLYVDSVHKVRSQTNHTEDNFESLERDSSNLSVDSSFENSELFDFIDVKAALQAEISESSESLDSPFIVWSKKMDSEKLGSQGSDLNQELVMTSSPKLVECENIDSEKSGCDEDDGKIDLESQCVMMLGHKELSDATNFFEIPLVLPSLKAPSDSWLKKTLPNINARSQTIVKSSIVHHEEVLKPIAED